MKKRSLLIALLLFSQLTLFATTPFNLEGLKSVNILLLDQSDILTPIFEERLKKELKVKLEKNGITTTKDGVGALFVKINAIKVGNVTVAYITLGVGEETTVLRRSQIESFALTYSYEDMIESTKIEDDVYDSVMNFLIDEFLEQYYEDNEI